MDAEGKKKSAGWDEMCSEDGLPNYKIVFERPPDGALLETRPWETMKKKSTGKHRCCIIFELGGSGSVQDAPAVSASNFHTRQTHF